MLAYKLLSLGYVLGEHRLLSSREALSMEPGLNAHGLIGAALYFDAQVEYPERLTLETAISAREHGATVLTYCRVDRILVEASTVRGVEFTDVLNGTRHQAQAAVTINVTGPWVDEVLRKTGQPVNQLVGVTKGSHLIVEPFPSAPRHALYVEAGRDGRPYFIVPWTGLYLIGTTDLYYQGDRDQVTALEEEIEYLVQETNHILPAANLTAEKIAYCYSGLRPLPYVLSSSPGGITRRPFIHDHAPELSGLYSVVGGKITTYRNLGEQAVDAVLRKLGRRAPRSMTAANPLPGADGEDVAREALALGARYSLGESIVARLLRIYGRRAMHVLNLCGEDLRWRQDLSAGAGAIGAEVVFAFRTEMARTLSDVLLRRTMVGMRPDLGVGADRAAAEIAVQSLGWSRDVAQHEVMEYRRYIERFKVEHVETVGQGTRG
jgi:glycerol-3-phosphate dehydrogenase